MGKELQSSNLWRTLTYADKMLPSPIEQKYFECQSPLEQHVPRIEITNIIDAIQRCILSSVRNSAILESFVYGPGGGVTRIYHVTVCAA